MAEYVIVEKDDLTSIADAIRAKTGTTDGMTIEEMTDNIHNIVGISSDISYVVLSTPVSFTLSADGWNGTSYSLKAENYQVGVNDVQIGLPSKTSTVNAQAVVKAALTIVKTSNTSANTSDSTPAYATLTISAVNAPTKDITIAIFGLEAAT